MPYRDLREYLQKLEAEGELIRIKESLSPVYEIPSILKHLGVMGGPAALVENVEGYNVPIAGNLFGSVAFKKVALALETQEDNLLQEFEKRRASPIPPKLVEREKAPVKQVIIKDSVDLMKTIPITKSHVGDVGPYITQGLMLLKDPDTGARDMALRRLQVKGPNRLGVYFGGTTARRAWEKQEAGGKPLEVGIAIGVDPALLIAGNVWAPFSDRIALAGGLRKQEVELVKCETVDVDVPANAMFVIEGKIIPSLIEQEGPFGEMVGYYHSTMNAVMEVTAITHQKNPIYSTYVTYSKDDAMIWDGLSKVVYSPMLKALVPSLKDFHYSVVDNRLFVSITKMNEWDSREALYSILTIPLAKIMVVVDDDVDVDNEDEVKWALAGRFRPDEDVIIISGVRGLAIEPSCKDGMMGSRLGIDATRPTNEPGKFEKISVPKETAEKTLEILQKYLAH